MKIDRLFTLFFGSIAINVDETQMITLLSQFLDHFTEIPILSLQSLHVGIVPFLEEQESVGKFLQILPQFLRMFFLNRQCLFLCFAVNFQRQIRLSIFGRLQGYTIRIQKNKGRYL